MWLKILCSTVILISCGTIGVLVANNYRLRPWQLKSVKNSLQMLETEIVYGLTPLPEALEKINSQISKPIATLYKVTAEGLKRNEYSVSAAWSKGVDALKYEAVLVDRDYDLLKNFGNYLGSTSKEEQVKHIRLIQDQISQQEVLAEKDKEKGEKVWKYSGFLVGAVIVLLIY